MKLSLCRWILSQALLGVVIFGPGLVASPSPSRAQSVPAPRLEDSETAARRLTLEEIAVVGNNRTGYNTILGYARLVPGDPVDLDAFDAARERLLATGYFKSVEFSTRPGSRIGQVLLFIEVVERSPVSFETGFGYDDLHGWFLTIVGLRLDQALLDDSRLRLGWRFGFRISGLDADWQKSVSPGGRFSVGLRGHLYQQQHLFFGSGPQGSQPWQGPEAIRFQQQIARAGAELTLDFRPRTSNQFTFGLRAEAVLPDSTFQNQESDQDFDYTNLPPELQNDLGRANITGFVLRGIHDTRDFVPYPTTGSFALLSIEANNTYLGGDLSYTRARVDLRKHFSVRGGGVFSNQIKSGVATRGAPYYERFYLGGIYWIRGFEEWSLSPVMGDDMFWMYSGEFRFPLVKSHGRQPRLTGLLFFDAGQGWNHNDIVSADDINSAWGYGFRLKLPWLGTLGLDAGIPLTPGRTGDPYRVHVSLGMSF